MDCLLIDLIALNLLKKSSSFVPVGSLLGTSLKMIDLSLFYYLLIYWYSDEYTLTLKLFWIKLKVWGVMFFKHIISLLCIRKMQYLLPP